MIVYPVAGRPSPDVSKGIGERDSNLENEVNREPERNKTSQGISADQSKTSPAKQSNSSPERPSIQAGGKMTVGTPTSQGRGKSPEKATSQGRERSAERTGTSPTSPSHLPKQTLPSHPPSDKG